MRDRNLRLKKTIVATMGFLPVFVFSNFASAEMIPENTVHIADLTIQDIEKVNDTFFTTDADDASKQWYLPKISIPEAWSESKGDNSVIVAVVDTGVLASHLDLNDGRIIAGYDSIKDRPIAENANSDDNGHGTAVTGVIAAIPDNNRGVAGINFDVSIMPIKALDSSGNGTITNVSEGIIWAADHGAHIINLSLGSSGFDENPILTKAISHAFNKGAIIVAAAGNDSAQTGLNLDTKPGFPICADNGQNMIIGVAASDINDRKADFSNFGINCVDITAPGKRILTTAYLPTEPSNNLLIYGSGTSLATPIVSGVAALIKAAHPRYKNTQIRDLILKNTDNINLYNQNNCLNSSCNGFLGQGRINAEKALNPEEILNGSLVRQESSGKIYLIEDGIKRLVPDFVLEQLFAGSPIIDEQRRQLRNFSSGDAVMPSVGTLIKTKTSRTVYYVDKNVIRPLNYLVFRSRNFSFADVKTISSPDFRALPIGEWYWPPDKTLVLQENNPTVFVMDEGVVRPTTYFVFTQRQLSFANVITVTADEFTHLPKPIDTYWLPPVDGTLIKSDTSDAVFLIEKGLKRPLTEQAFKLGKYKFSNIKILPQAEVDVIAPGDPA